MAFKLGEMLVRAGKITPAQLEETLKSQVIFGGRLGTNLIEMGYVEEDELVEFLCNKLRFPYALPEQLLSIPPEIIKLIPKEIAEKYKVIPLSRDKKRLTLAMLDPTDLSAIDAISFMTGYYIIPVVALELRLAPALEKYYGIRRDVRYISVAGKGRTRLSVDKTTEPKEVSSADLVDFSKLDIDDVLPDFASPQIAGLNTNVPARQIDKGAEQELDLVDLAQQQGVDEVLESGGETGVTAEPARQLPAVTGPAMSETALLTVDAVSAKLAEAKDREEIADIIVAFLGQEFERAALFMIRGNMANGWKSLRNNIPIDGFGNLRLSLERPSVLKVVAESRSFYLGAIPDAPENTMMLAGLGGEMPSAALLVPLVMMGRTVTIFYVDGGVKTVANRLADLQKLVGKAAMAFEILILKNKILAS